MTHALFAKSKSNLAFTSRTICLLSKLYYFSDGCGGQYKNYKNFHNLCYHSEDFGLDAEWAFFATSHGKSPCDGIGSSVKWTITTASLQRTTINHILTVDSMYALCLQNIKSITFIQIFKETMIIVREFLNKRFETSNTVPGSRSHHHYIPLSKNTIAFKRTSEDVKLTHFNLVTGVNPLAKFTPIDIKILKPSYFIACNYDSFWWIGMIAAVDIHNGDLKIKFVHPHGPFSWPSRDDYCWVPIVNIITHIKVPTTKSR